MSTGSVLHTSGQISRRAKSVPASMLAERSARKEVPYISCKISIIVSSVSGEIMDITFRV